MSDLEPVGCIDCVDSAAVVLESGVPDTAKTVADTATAALLPPLSDRRRQG